MRPSIEAEFTKGTHDAKETSRLSKLLMEARGVNGYLYVIAKILLAILGRMK